MDDSQESSQLNTEENSNGCLESEKTPNKIPTTPRKILRTPRKQKCLKSETEDFF